VFDLTSGRTVRPHPGRGRIDFSAWLTGHACWPSAPGHAESGFKSRKPGSA